jgi:hypothetical protein
MFTTIVIIIGYGLVTFCTFVGVAWCTDQLDRPWQSPLPFLCSLLWPMAAPLVGLFGGATYVCGHLQKKRKAAREREAELQKRVEELERELRAPN